MSKPEKFILDATAGFRRMWFNKQHPNCLYIDERPECEPDQIADFTHLNFPDETFRLIVFDPPHILKTDRLATMRMVRQFGALHAETWQKDIKLGFQELWRVLKPYGVLIFKWSNTDISSSEILKFAPEPPLFYQISASKYRSVDGSRKKAKNGTDTTQTLWFCFMKIPKTEVTVNLV